MKTVKQLRQAGYKVRVVHKRKLKNLNVLCSRADADECGFRAADFVPHGGATFVSVTTPDGDTSLGDSRCSKNDNFNRRVGLNIALGRALKQLG